jgi:tRNA 2-selenouridine synthase
MSDNTVPAGQFTRLLVAETPFLDVRAEAEFAKGRFPTSLNLPILMDDERARVGICYKEKGQEAAVKLGHQLVGGEIRDRRIEAWCDFATRHPGTHVYCWRGGMRSNLAQQWIQEAGVEVPLVEGGFKALRRLMINTIDDVAARVPMLRIGGKTGTAKTVLINALGSSTDLEGHANHRGSSFGRRPTGVPTQIDFEHALGIDLLRKCDPARTRTLIVEDESRRIGSCAIPQSFHGKMIAAEMAVIEMPQAFRVERIRQEYVEDMSREYLEADQEEGWPQFVDYLTQSLVRVQKRLGMENYGKISALMNDALAKQEASGDTIAHEAWIIALLRDYYDPMCDYQLGNQTEKIVFRGDYDEVLDWAQQQSS